MKKNAISAPVVAARQGADIVSHSPAAAQLHASPHMVAQRQQLAGAFGSVQLAAKKKPPAQMKGEKKKPGKS